MDSTNPLKPLLDAYKKKQSYNNIVAIQTELKKGTHALVVDGDFGENTLEALLEQTTADSTIESAPSAAGNKDSAEKPVTSNETLFKTGTTLVYSDGAYHLV